MAELTTRLPHVLSVAERVSREGETVGLVNGQMQYRCSNCGNVYTVGGGQPANAGGAAATTGPSQISGPSPGYGMQSSVDPEFAFYAHDDNAHPEQSMEHDSGWMDSNGSPLREGQDYELISHANEHDAVSLLCAAHICVDTAAV